MVGRHPFVLLLWAPQILIKVEFILFHYRKSNQPYRIHAHKLVMVN